MKNNMKAQPETTEPLNIHMTDPFSILWTGPRLPAKTSGAIRPETPHSSGVPFPVAPKHLHATALHFRPCHVMIFMIENV